MTGQYAAAGVKLARRLQLPYVDLWTEVAKQEGWATEFLEDGLHLTSAGNKAVFELIAAKIHEAIPALRCVTLVLCAGAYITAGTPSVAQFGHTHVPGHCYIHTCFTCMAGIT